MFLHCLGKRRLSALLFFFSIGWWGIWTSFLAFYCGAASLFKDMWGKYLVYGNSPKIKICCSKLYLNRCCSFFFVGMDVLPQRFTKVYDKTSRVLFPRAQVDPETGDIEDGGILKKH
jgi:hypothetical protein